MQLSRLKPKVPYPKILLYQHHGRFLFIMSYVLLLHDILYPHRKMADRLSYRVIIIV